jgi:hypothetical protein
VINLIPAEYRAAAMVAAVLAAVLALGLFGGGMYWWGNSNGRNGCAAANGKANAKIEKAEDKRDLAIDGIAAATAEAVAQELNRNRGLSDERSERIRTVEVPGNCRAVDPVIVRELRQARDGVNAALGVGLRPSSTEPDPANP